MVEKLGEPVFLSRADALAYLRAEFEKVHGRVVYSGS
jgi:hypothetical protein